MFSWQFNWCFRIANDYQWFFTLNTLFNEVDKRLGYLLKKLLDSYHLHPFLLKTVTSDWSKWLVVTLSENKYCAQKDGYV